MRQATLRIAALCAATAVLTFGCSKKADNTSNFTSAINTYYAAHPACLWDAPIKFPVQADTADTAKTAPYDALVDQGMLVRTNAEKKVFIVASKHVNNYDLSDKGRTSWTADQTQPGFGNFCYGHRKVGAIDATTPTNDQPGATTVVNYHYTLADVPSWAPVAETQAAYPDLRASLSGPLAAQATLTNTTNGWAFTSAPDTPRHSAPATAADGKIVQ